MSGLRRHAPSFDWAEGVHLLPSAGVLAVWTVLMASDGGFYPDSWLPAGIVLTGLLVVAIAGGGRVLPLGRPARAVLLAFAAFTAFNAISLLWSDARGDAYEATQLLVVTLLSAWVLGLAPWRPHTATALAALFSVAAAAVCLVTLLGVLGEDALTPRFTDFRFNPPLGYPNATAALSAMAAVPALVLAARPEGSIAGKALLQAVATLLVAYTLLPQSRGSVIGGAAALVVSLALVPYRWRLVAHAVAAAVVVTILGGPIIDLYGTVSSTGRASGALDDAARAVVLAAVLGLVAGVALALTGRRVRLDGAGQRRARIAGIAAIGVLAVAGLATAAVASDRIGNALDDQWQALKHPGSDFAGREEGAGASHFTSADPLERYDYWRVSVASFRDAPLLGIGAGGFQHRYALDRRYAKPSKFPHNLAMKVLGDNGLVGVLLIGAVLAATALGLLRRLGDAPAADRAVVALAAGLAAYFTGHAMFDWLEAYPVLTAPALSFVLVALAVRDRTARLASLPAAAAAPAAAAPAAAAPPPGDRPRRRPGLPVLGWAGVAVVALCVAGSLLASWGAERYRHRASDIWRAQPQQAYDDLRRAAALNPFAPDPLVLKGVIAVTRGDLATGRTAFEGALAREQAWLPRFTLGMIAAEQGDRATASAQWDRALAENRLDPVMPGLIAEARKARRVDAAQMLRRALTSPLVNSSRLT